MRLPIISGIIDRRILVNFRVDPTVLSPILPQPFRPQLVDGYGIAGICLIRLKNLRPSCLPPYLGIASENAAHRIAVEWTDKGERRKGVYIPRRDTSSVLNVLAGGRVFPGTHHLARFESREHDDRYDITMESHDGRVHVRVKGDVAADLRGDSIFDSTDHVSDFFEAGSLGYSPNGSLSEFDGLELRTRNWQVTPLSVDGVESSFFADRSVFPAGSIHYDCALLMRGIDHEWHNREPLCCADAVA